MKKTINIAKLISTDIRSRANANLIRDEIDKLQNSIVEIDMTSVVFVSRSFADELLEIQKTGGKCIDIINARGEVKDMLEIVSASRIQKRTYHESHNDTVVLQDMASLKKFFAAM